MVKKIRAIVLIPLFALFVSTATSAAGGHTLTVTPSITEVLLDPGSSTMKRVTVANQGEKDFTLRLTVAPYSIINDNYEASFEAAEGRKLVNEWITFTQSAGNTVSVGKYVDVDMTIKVPAGTPAGGYSAALLVESSIDKVSSSGVSAKNRIAHIIYINVKGDVEQKGQVKASTVPLIAFSGDQNVRYTASNLGGTNEKAKVDVYVEDMFGRRISGQLVERYVLPGTKRHIDTAWTPMGLFGVYNVTTSYSFAGAEDSDDSHWTVIVHPIFLLLAVGVIVASVWFRVSRFVIMKRKKAKP